MAQAKSTSVAAVASSPELQEFVAARKRSAVFICVNETLSLKHVIDLRKEIANHHFDELDMIVDSGGGDINAAYQIIELLRLHATKITACVPFYAKSAATLLCIGADAIVLDELAQLGPLDTQIQERGRGGKTEWVSALNPFKALEQMQNFAIETLDLSMKMIVQRSGMDLDECFKHGMEFVRVTTGPLIAQLNPEKLGAYSRALSIGEEYGKRLLKRCSNWGDKQIDKVVAKLVHGYPSHDYIIDYKELQELGFRVELFKDEERDMIQKLTDYLLEGKTVIKLIKYDETTDKSRGKEK